MKVKDWFTNEKKWCKFHAAVDEGGNEIPCYGSNSDISALCLYGATVIIYPEFDEQHRILKLIDEKIGKIPVGTWNDNATFEQVKALVEELDI